MKANESINFTRTQAILWNIPVHRKVSWTFIPPTDMLQHKYMPRAIAILISVYDGLWLQILLSIVLIKTDNSNLHSNLNFPLWPSLASLWLGCIHKIYFIALQCVHAFPHELPLHYSCCPFCSTTLIFTNSVAPIRISATVMTVTQHSTCAPRCRLPVAGRRMLGH